MAAQEGSPNWYWQELGYQVERQPLPCGSNARTIRRPDGSAVEIDRRPGEHIQDAEVRVAMTEQRQPHQHEIFHDTKEPAA